MSNHPESLPIQIAFLLKVAQELTDTHTKQHLKDHHLPPIPAVPHASPAAEGYRAAVPTSRLELQKSEVVGQLSWPICIFVSFQSVCGSPVHRSGFCYLYQICFSSSTQNLPPSLCDVSFNEGYGVPCECLHNVVVPITLICGHAFF